MDVEAVRERARAFGEALVEGDVGRATEDVSKELQRNLGEVLALFPLPAIEATIESVDQSGAGFNVVLRLVGESEEVQVQTRWKDRDGHPTMVEASHLSRTERAEATEADEAADDDGPAGSA